MKDLRPPTCRTHSIVTHTTCSSTYMYTLNKCIHYTHYTLKSHTRTDTSCRQTPYLFTSIQQRKEVAKLAASLPLNASLRIRTCTRHVHGSRRNRHTPYSRNTHTASFIFHHLRTHRFQLPWRYIRVNRASS